MATVLEERPAAVSGSPGGAAQGLTEQEAKLRAEEEKD